MIEGFYLSNWPQGWLYGWRVGEQIGPLRPCPNPEEILQEFAPMFGEEPEKLDGLTLFYHHPKGWQLSTREKDQHGWSVRIIPDEQAFKILSAMEKRGHPIMLDREESIRQFGTVKDPMTKAEGRSREEIEAEISAAKQAELRTTADRNRTLLDVLAVAEEKRNSLTELLIHALS